jgi:hypothetical protein
LQAGAAARQDSPLAGLHAAALPATISCSDAAAARPMGSAGRKRFRSPPSGKESGMFILLQWVLFFAYLAVLGLVGAQFRLA